MKKDISPSHTLKFSHIVALDAPHTGQYDQYMKDAVIDGDKFVADFRENRHEEDDLHARYNAWFNSPEGQNIILRLVRRILSDIDAYPADCVPGHDKRHVFKDLAASFHILEEENFMHDWRALLLLPSLLHDSGRLVEEKFVGEDVASKGDGKIHAYLSYKMLQEMLDNEPSIPQNLKNEMLYAVLMHQSGGGQDRTMSWAVQRADREQLTGGELFSRILSANVGGCGTGLKTKFDAACTPVWSPESTFLDSLTLYEHRLYANLGKYGEDRATQFKARAIAGIQIASLGNGANIPSDTALDQWQFDPFIRWVETGWKRPEVGEKVVPVARHILKKAAPLLSCFPQEDAVSFLIKAIEEPTSHLSASIKARLQNLMNEVSGEGRLNYVRSMLLMQHCRATADADDLDLLRKIEKREDAPLFIRELAKDCASRMGQVKTPTLIHELKIDLR